MAHVLKRAKGRYLIRVFLGRDEGGRQHYHNETMRGSRDDALRRARTLERQRDLGEPVQQTKATLGQYIDYWLGTIKPRVRPQTYLNYTTLIDTHIRPRMGRRRLTGLTPLDVQSLYTRMESAGLSTRTVNYVHFLLNRALNQAVRWDLLSRNPATHTHRPKHVRTRRIQPFDEQECESFLRAAARMPRYYALFLTSVSTGLRPEELLALQWDDVDLVGQTIKVSRTLVRRKGGWSFDKPKTPKGYRVVPLPEATVAALKQHRRSQNKERIAKRGYATHNLVFATPQGEPLNEANLRRRQLQSILNDAGLTSRRMYDLRHSWVTLSLAAGVSPKVVSEWAGHSSVAFTLDTYSHLIPSWERSAAIQLDAIFGRQKTKKAR
jgi:integrase